MEQLYVSPSQVEPSAPAPPLAHGKLNLFGIGGLTVSLSSALGLIIAMIGAALLAANGAREDSPGMILLGLMILAGVGGSLVAIGLGIAGLFQAGRSKLTAAIAIGLSCVTLFLMLILMLIGLATG
jgi:hypothetical protein